MNPLQLIREQPDAVRATLEKRHFEAPLARIVELDTRSRALRAEVEQLRAERNKGSKGGQPSEAVKYERDVARPRSQHSADAPFHLSPVGNDAGFRIVLFGPERHASIGKDHAPRAIWRIEAHNDVPVTGEIFDECRVVQHPRRSTGSEDHHGIRSCVR